MPALPSSLISSLTGAPAVTVRDTAAGLRLDAWRTNEALHAYYRKAGFQHVRTVEYPHRGSGALFQRATSQDCR
jgi:hypothetical protein